MAYPTKYTRQYDFASYQASNPTRPLPGTNVNTDLDAVKLSVAEIVEFLKLFTRADGALANGSVGVNQLDSTFDLGFSLPTTWEAGVDYTTDSTVLHDNKFWIANVEHTSSDGFDESKWDEIVDFGEQATNAAASATAAAASETAAATSASTATTQAGNASTSATNASNSADAAAASETAAGGSADAAAASAIAADGSADAAAASAIAADGSADAAAASAASISFASQAEAEAGVSSTKVMSPLRTAEAIAALATGGVLYGTVADVEAATIPAIVETIQTAGYTTAGDGGGSIATNATYERVGSEPSHQGKIQSDDGAWWELTGAVVNVKQFGAIPVVSALDTDPDAAAAINLCIAYCNAKGNVDMRIPSGTWPLDSALTPPTFIIEINGEQGGAQPTILYKRYVEADTNKGVLSFGAWGATVTDIQFAAKSGASGGSSLSAILPNNAANIGVLRLRNIYSSCGDGVNSNLYINGVANTGGGDGTGGKSYRSVFLENCHFFGAAQYSVVLLSVQHCFATNIFTDSSGGTMSSGIVFNCTGNATSINDDIYWSGILGGVLNLDHTTRSVFNCVVTGNIANTANVSDVTVTEGKGSIDNAWLTSRVINDNNTWITSSPTPTPSGGSFTATGSVAYKTMGKTVFCRGTITISAAGTGTGSINMALPFTLKAPITFGGKESAVNGLAYVAYIATNSVGILKYDNNTHIATGATFPFSFTAELA